ncbi:hypothetical protein [Streptomyces sp. NPDC050164]|uniref:hypothetical protein n=1 Tax=Streptomyces sp. NPDC050164 TaxID=3365605 RepID=UPI00379C2A86
MPTNSGIARSTYCCRTATPSVPTAATFSSVLATPGARQLALVLENRVAGQDRLADTHRQLRPVGDAVVDGIVDGQEREPVPVEVAESVLGIEGAVPQLPRRLVRRREHQPQPGGLSGGNRR